MIDHREGREIIKEEKNNAISLNILDDYYEVLDFAHKNAAYFLVKNSDGSTSPCLDLEIIEGSDGDWDLDGHFDFNYNYEYYDSSYFMRNSSKSVLLTKKHSKSVLLTKNHIDIPKEVKTSEVDNYVAETYKSELEALHNFVKITMPEKYEEKIESLEKSEHSKILQELQILTYDSTPLKNLRKVFGEFKHDDSFGEFKHDGRYDTFWWVDIEVDTKVREIFANYMIYDHINELLAYEYADLGTSDETWDYDYWGCYSKGSGTDLLDNACEGHKSSRSILQKLIKNLPVRFDIHCDAEDLAIELLDSMKSLTTTDPELKIDFTQVFYLYHKHDTNLKEAFGREVNWAFYSKNEEEDGWRLGRNICLCTHCLNHHPWDIELTELNLKQKPICPKSGTVIISEDEEWWFDPCCRRSTIVSGEHDHLIQQEKEDEDGNWVKVPINF